MIKDVIKRAWCSVITFGKSLPRWARGKFIWALLIAPVLFVALMYALINADAFGWQQPNLCKSHLEVVHPALLGCALVLAVAGWLRTKDYALAGLSVLCGGAFAREMLGQGHSFIFIIAMFAVIIFIEQKKTRAKALLDSKWATSLLAMTFVCYIFSQLLDRGLIKRIGRLVTMNGKWKPPYSSNIEEGLETFGGLFLLFTVITVLFVVKQHRSGDRPAGEGEDC